MITQRITALCILIGATVLGYALFTSVGPTATGTFARHPFRLGLDLSGGTHLLYEADISQLQFGQVDDSMDALRDVIERRVNLFGVAEPVVAVQTSTVSGETLHRLSVELPGVTNVSEAIDMIGATPFLEFRIQSDQELQTTVVDGVATVDPTANFIPTDLTGKYLKQATLEFVPGTGEALVSLQFNEEGSVLFEQITGENVGKVVAIYLDGQVISAPVVREAIAGGRAQISGTFTAQEAKMLVGRLNSGALPVPISLVSTQTIGAVLGVDAVTSGVRAAIAGFIAVALFLILWYRLPGLIGVLALAIYMILTVFVYRFMPVTLSAAGIAGFIISIGMAVDANILIFERMREERARGKKATDAISDGFSRAWLSIRDANTASFIIAIILFWFGTSLIKGFALTFGLGVLISLVLSVVVTRVFLRSLPEGKGKAGKFFFGSGFTK